MATFQVLDSGPLYAETLVAIHSTDPSFPIEPLNTLSNLPFLFVVLLFTGRVVKARTLPGLFALALPTLFLGFIGGVLYHGFRSWDVWYYLDFIPILILSQLTTAYFYWRAKWLLKGMITLFLLEAFFLFIQSLVPPSWDLHGTLFYLPLAISMLQAMILVSRCERHFRYDSLFLFAVLTACALGFRSLDQWAGQYFPRGSHFLWHLCGAIATSVVAELLWHMEKARKSSHFPPQELRKMKSPRRSFPI